MKSLKPIFCYATVLVSALHPHSLYAQEVCEAFVKYGIYDSRKEASDVDKTESFRAWFCQSKFESKEAADQAGMKLGYGSFKLGYDSNRESWSQFSENYCRDESYKLKYREVTNSFVQSINTKSSDNMLACFMRDGLHARVVQGVRRDTFYLQARFNPTSDVVSHAEVFNFEVRGGTCNGLLKRGFKITPAGVEQLCERTSNQAVDISLSASQKVNWDSPRGLAEIKAPEATVSWQDILKKPITANLLPGSYEVVPGPAGQCKPKTGNPVVVSDAGTLIAINECGQKSRMKLVRETITFLDWNNLSAELRRNSANGAIEIHAADGNKWVNGPDKLR